MNPMLKFSFIITILLLNQFCFAQSDFWQQTGALVGGASYSITNIFCAADGSVYVTTSDSGINKSTDNGISWTLFSRKIVRTIYVNTNGDMYIARDSIQKSTDNGLTWITGENTKEFWTTITSNSSGDLFAVGNTVIRSTDNGSNWLSTTGFIGGGGNSIAVDLNDNLFIGCWSVGIYRSTNDGILWSQTSFMMGDVNGLTVHPNNNVYAATYNNVWKSTDIGVNWVVTGTENLGLCRAIIATTSGDIYVAGESNAKYGVFKSTDEGSTWTGVNSGFITSQDSIITKLGISPDGYLFACATSGKVFRSAEPVMGVSASDELPTGYSLKQNYPNPFNPITNVSFVIGHSSLVSLKVFDVLGREIAVLVNENKQPGEYNVRWDAKEVPSGVYFYRLIAGDFVQTNRMILIR